MAAGAAARRGRRHDVSPSDIAASGGIEGCRKPRCSASGGRMQMAYAWYPEPDRLELRYVASPPAQRAVRGLALRRQRAGAEPRRHSPLFELVRARNHRSVRRSVFSTIRSRIAWCCTRASSPAKPPFDPGYPPDRPLHMSSTTRIRPGDRRRRGRCAALPFGPVRADVLESAEFLFFYVGEAILHYHPRLFFKHRGMEKRFEGARAGARRRAGRAGFRCRQRRPRAGLLSGGRSRLADASFRRARNSCACCWPRWSGFTTICTISAISVTPRRSRSAKPRANCLRSGPSKSTPG